MRYFCHFHYLSVRLIFCPQIERYSHFGQDILLADKNQKHEEASEKVEAINDSEENLKIAKVIFTGDVTVVAMNEIVETGEGPEDAKDGEEFAEEDLEQIRKFVNYKQG